MSDAMPSGTGNQKETPTMIAASKVSGARVCNPTGESLGSIHDVMLDKRSGHVTYAVMSFGGFLGIGEKYHPLPWHQLTYNEAYDAYVVNLDKRMLEAAPSYGTSEVFDWSSNRRNIDDYYGATKPPLM
jgi:sporulation protein YlmC with PRC-barrel domain